MGKLNKAVISTVLISFFLIVSFLLWGGTASFRYGYNLKDYKRIIYFVKNKDIKKLNHMLLGVNSITSKLTILSYLEKFNHDSSIKPILTLLDYSIPFWDQIDSESPNPAEVRFGSFETILHFNKNKVMEQLGRKRVRTFGDLYANAIKAYYGNQQAKKRLFSYKDVKWANDDYWLISKYLKVEAI